MLPVGFAATPDDFEYCLERALDGETLSDQGMCDDVEERLRDVAMSFPGAELDAAVAAARAAFAAQLTPESTRAASSSLATREEFR
jgi:hypothetical protein